MLTEKPEHMTDEEWTAFNDDEMGEAPKAKYEDAEVKLDDDVEALLTPDTEKDENHNKANDDVVEFLNLDDIEVPDITGADSKLEKLTSEYTIAKNELSDLQQKWDDGELTEAEYNIETSVLERKMARLEGKIEAAEEQAEEEAAKIERYNQQIQLAWNQEEKAFFEQPENKAFLESPRKLEALNKIVTELQQNPNLTPKDFNKLLKDARNSYVQEFGEFYQGARQPESKSQPTKQQPRKVEPPKTLAHVPVAEPNNVLDGRFAVLDNIKDPEQLEKAIARMSQSDRDAYLRGAA
jgi:chromosome segregation ATPase